VEGFGKVARVGGERREGEKHVCMSMAGMVWSRARFSCPLRVAVQV
jgi:hypothetical protein